MLVTGSRIQRTGMVTPTPVTAVTSTELQNMAPGQMINALSQLPQFSGNLTPQTTRWWIEGVGGALNLRGAGLNRTLVLLDGRRVAPTNRQGVANTSDLPEPFIQRVETVTGGASAAYGTDAVAGVVNFLLDTNFDGLEARVKTGRTTFSDGESRGATLAFGTDIGERLHFQVAGDYYHQDGIGGLEALKRRGFFKQWARVTNPDPNGPSLIIRPFVRPTNFSYTGIINAPGSALNKMEFVNTDQGVSVRPLEFSGVGDLDGGCNCQAEPSQTYGVDQDDWLLDENQRENLFTYLDYDLSDKISVYFQAMASDSYTRAPWVGITLSGPWQATIFSGNPFLPSEVQAIMDQEGLESFGFGLFGRNNSNTPLGTYTVKTTQASRSGTFGFDAELGDNWGARGYVQYGKNDEENILHNPTRVDTLFLGLDAVRNPATGAIECRAAQVNPETFGDCVPINLFGGVQNLSPEAAEYILNPRPMSILNFIDQTVAELVLDGTIAQGWGAGPISMAAGASYREDSMRSWVPDLRDEFVYLNGENTHLRGLVPEDQPNGMPGVRPGSVPPGYLGNNSLSVNLFTASIQNETASAEGTSHVSELFSELDIPLLSGRPLAQQLGLNVAARWADYSASGGIWAWKYGLNWQVTDALRIRGTRSRDVRAPTLHELFEQTGGGASVEDPELGGIRYSTQVRVGGNPSLRPEEADTFTLGAVFQPPSVPGLGISVDWYDIDVHGAIAEPSAQDLVDLCFQGARDLCELITRDPDTQRIVSIAQLYTNLDDNRVKGVDVEMTYRRDVDWFGAAGTLSTRFLGSWLDENSIKSPGAPRDDRAGEVGGMALPKRKFTAHLGYGVGPVDVFLQGRWIDGGVLNRFYVEGVDIDDNSVPSIFYTDLHFSYSGSFAGGGNWQAFAQISNLFNREPVPTPGGVGRTGTNEFNQSLYDTLGRFFDVGVNLSF
ncbi:MAG TPA: TonB-dependent receptor [Gammaproteobacteria bacterium]